eukprot:scaffold133694_cov22-Tisochrysis_lutea.AAC.1
MHLRLQINFADMHDAHTRTSVNGHHCVRAKTIGAHTRAHSQSHTLEHTFAQTKHTYSHGRQTHQACASGVCLASASLGCLKDKVATWTVACPAQTPHVPRWAPLSTP